ncbi:hypothetical protein J6590_030082 [Homalodisca vitripennis]|nr:hypothetical protein J6590_030082 [Homalodisca vitripennis]
MGRSVAHLYHVDPALHNSECELGNQGSLRVQLTEVFCRHVVLSMLHQQCVSSSTLPRGLLTYNVQTSGALTLSLSRRILRDVRTTWEIWPYPWHKSHSRP